MGRGSWSTGVWRYKVIKRYRRRAQKFKDEARTIEEKMAWLKVIKWFEDILDHRELNQNEAISLIDEDVKEFAELTNKDGSK